MLIPAAISLLLSTIFVNLSLLIPGQVSLPGKIKEVKVGRVMGVSDSAVQADIFVARNDNLSKAIVKVVEDAKTLSLPRLFQPSGLEEPMRRLPRGQEKKIAEPELNFDLPAESGVILDGRDNGLLFAKRPDRPWPIASITKLFTAYTFLDYNPGWEESYVIKAEDRREGGQIYLFTGDKVTVKDLFYFSLVGSDNTAAAALVGSSGLSEEEFVQKMNDKIKELGLKNTRLADVTGLADGNISTAREIALFAKVALAAPEISDATLTKKYEFITAQGKKRLIDSTDRLLDVFPENGIAILGGKTGFTNAAGYCLVGRFKDGQGREIITVVLGANSDSARFDATKELVDLYYGGKE